MLVSLTAAQPCLSSGWQALTSASGQPPFSSEAACVHFVGTGGTPVAVGESFSVSIIGPDPYGGCDLRFTGTGLMAGATVYGSNSNGPFTVYNSSYVPMTVPSNGVLNDVALGFNAFTATFSVQDASGNTVTYGPLAITC
jgi:hypothetical protein